jgi:hypothetical protein
VISKASKLVEIVRIVGPRPVVLAETVWFVARRRRREQRARSLYASPLPATVVDLQLPRIGLAPYRGLPVELRAAADAIRAEAEEVAAHRVDFLGSGLVSLGPEIDWHRDFKSGYRWDERFYQDLEVTRPDDSSDAKVPWELSRCHQLLTLARAARLFEDERFAAALEAQLDSWLTANPPGIGINWVNPMEVAIRAVNLLWSVGTLEEWRPLDAGIRDRLVTSLRWHGHHIRGNLEGSPYLRSNHYLSDLIGLLVLGWALRGEPAARGWLEFARRQLEREAVSEVHGDGVGFEASLSYHGLVLELLLVAVVVAEWAERLLSADVYDRVVRMVEVSRGARHPDGRIPLFGDQDSGRVLPAGFERTPSHDNLLWLASAVLDRPRPLAGTAHPEVAWTLGVEAWRRARARADEVGPPRSAFPDGGLYVLRSPRTHVVARCGDVGQNGFGGHGHNDMLSFELSVDGVPLIVDSGTYAYTFDVAARNAFRATRAHNTLSVDDQEIHPIDPDRVFELRRFAHGRVESLELDGPIQRLVVSHDGYRRLDPPISVRRSFSLDGQECRLTVDDHASGAGDHLLSSYLHFAPGTTLHRSSDLGFEARRTGARAAIVFHGVEAQELAAETGWVSSKYGEREPAPVLVASARRVCPTTLGYTVEP